MTKDRTISDGQLGAAQPAGSLKQALEAMLGDKRILQQHAQTVFNKVARGADRIEAGLVATALQELMVPFGVPKLDVSDPEVASVCSRFGNPQDGSLQQANFLEVCEMVLQFKRETWFPPVLPVSTRNFVRQNRRPVDEVYKVGHKLGEGSFGVVFSVEHKVSGEQRVCKKIAKSKSDMTSEQILQEIGNMAMLDHPNVIKVYEYFDDAEHVCQIMEPCNGGELQDKVDILRKTGQPPYTEAFICDVMKQTLRALAFMHTMRFMHKDLKPQNIMMVDKESSSIKVIDFGLAELFNPSQKFAAYIGGTLLYMAPEVFRQQMTVKVDVWSAGVILYNLLTGDFPFLAQWPPPPGRDEAWWQEQTIEKIKNEEPTRHASLRRWSPACLDFLFQMLRKDDRIRPDATQCLEHAWFRGYCEVAPTLSVGVVQCVEAYARMSELKKAIFLLMAHQCAVEALLELRALFTHFDVRNQGSLSTADLKTVLMASGMGVLVAERVIHALDRNGDGQITWTEFTAAAICVSVCRNRRTVDAAFATFDTDQDGKISARDLELVLTDREDVAGYAAWMQRLPSLFEELATVESKEPARPITDALKKTFFKPFKKEVQQATREQFRAYLGQKLDFRAGDALFPVS